MLYVIHLILLAVSVAIAVPMTPPSPMLTDQEILENSIDNGSSSSGEDDFSKELPFESEYYRTSTDRDEFVRPIPGPEENEIDDGEDGIDLDDTFTWNQTPDCTYHISIQLFYECIDRLDIKLDGVKLKSTSKSNLTLKDFEHMAQTKIFENIKGKNLTNELVNDVISVLRQTFTKTYGYEDYCGVSTNVITYFMKNETQNGFFEIASNEGITDIPDDQDSSTQIEMENFDTGNSESEAEILNDEISTVFSDVDMTTEMYQTKVLKRPKLSTIVQDSINFYKALHNWKFPPPS